MKTRLLIVLTVALFVFSTAPIQAQQSTPEQHVRPRTVTHPTVNPPAVKPPAVNPAAVNPPAVNPNVPLPGGAPVAEAAEKVETGKHLPLTYLTPSMIQSRISEARRLLKTRPMATAMTSPSIQFVTVAAL
ncbi:MAG TPA: hypothetical protein VFY34_06500, partial [Pyrinomonadaceae bacterium]|nr:hypothetical protein [Pyrinomonadaceae bacterium]